jgi:hypothetical protein
VVLLVLAIIWGVLLVSWFRSRSGGTLSDSVGTFRRHLNVLERATPTTVVPANRLRSAPVVARGIPAYRPPGRVTPGSRLGTSGGRPMPSARGIGLRPPAAAAIRRRQAQKRRRDIFFALLAGVLASLGLCAVPSLGLSVMWPVQLLCDLLFGAYILLLVRMRSLAAEREMKVRYMAYQRTAARPQPSYDFGAGYGELSLTRTAH